MLNGSWAWLIKISPWSQIFLRCVRADLDLIVNEFKQIGLIGLLVMNAAIRNIGQPNTEKHDRQAWNDTILRLGP